MKPHVVKGRAAGALHLGPAVELADIRRECGAGVLRLPVQDRFRDDRLDDRHGWRGSGGGGGGGGGPGGGPGGGGPPPGGGRRRPPCPTFSYSSPSSGVATFTRPRPRSR